MALWQELCLKGIVLLATVAALLGSLVVLAIVTLANGSALSEQDFSWAWFAADMLVVLSQVVLSIAGCRAGWKFIDRRSDELRSLPPIC